MNLRYYLRGLGIGITITAVLLIFLQSDKKGMMTDAEVKKRAAELGMVESTTLANLSSEKESEITSEPVAEPVSVDIPENNSENVSEDVSEEEGSEPISSEEVSEEASESISEEPSEAVSEPATEETSEVIPETPSEIGGEEAEEYVIITVKGGDGSGTVAKRVYEAGLVADAAEYDKFLCRNGYDKKIAPGNHEIKKGSSEEEIAKILCSRK